MIRRFSTLHQLMFSVMEKGAANVVMGISCTTRIFHLAYEPWGRRDFQHT
jgi:hypothetical protein